MMMKESLRAIESFISAMAVGAGSRKLPDTSPYRMNSERPVDSKSRSSPDADSPGDRERNPPPGTRSPGAGSA